MFPNLVSGVFTTAFHDADWTDLVIGWLSRSKLVNENKALFEREGKVNIRTRVNIIKNKVYSSSLQMFFFSSIFAFDIASFLKFKLYTCLSLIMIM